MSRYYFHVINGEFITDREGHECASLDEAKRYAVVVAGEMLKDQGLRIWKTRRYDMFVVDENGQTRLRVAFNVEDLTANQG